MLHHAAEGLPHIGVFVKARVLLLIWQLVFALQIVVYVVVPPVILLLILVFVYFLKDVARGSNYSRLVLSLVNFDTTK